MQISAIKLVRQGTDAVVLVEILHDGPCIVLNDEGQLDAKASQAARLKWIEVIREPFDAAFSHIVEESGLREAIKVDARQREFHPTGWSK